MVGSGRVIQFPTGSLDLTHLDIPSYTNSVRLSPNAAAKGRPFAVALGDKPDPLSEPVYLPIASNIPFRLQTPITRIISPGAESIVSQQHQLQRREDLETINHEVITTSGWYTFEHNFRDDNGVLAVDLNLNLYRANRIAGEQSRSAAASSTVIAFCNRIPTGYRGAARTSPPGSRPA